MPEALSLIMRWLHLTSMAALIGGVLYGRLVLVPASAALAEEQREALGDRAAASFRPFVVAAIVGLLLSGLYNVFTTPGHSPRYHTLLAVKLLLSAHVFTLSLLITRPHNPRRTRMMTGTLISGLAVVLIAAYLRRIF